VLNIRGVTALPLIEILSQDLGVRRIYRQELIQGTFIGKEKIKIVGAKEKNKSRHDALITWLRGETF
jgi:hypothetical protein